MRLIYSLLYSVAMMVALPYFFVVGLARRKYLSSAKQRFGFIPQSSEIPSCWIHCVSVGEFLAAKPLIQRLQNDFPELPVFISTTTITGQRLAAEFLPGRAFYFPFDWRWCIRRVFARIHPRLILILETEIWPNFLWEADDQNIPVMLVNGRLSDRSFRRYGMFRSWLPRFSATLMQSATDAARMRDLGAQPEIMGNLKFDFQPQLLQSPLRQLLNEWKGDRLAWMAGSTMAGEEEMLLQIYERLRSKFRLKLLIAPRHPQRFDEVASLIKLRGMTMARRSSGDSMDTEIFLLDSIGELASCYELADLVFIGGTYADYGGHNPIEPAFFGKAILTGTHYSNFRAVYEEFQRRNAICIAIDVASSAENLLLDTEERSRMGNAAKALVEENREQPNWQ